MIGSHAAESVIEVLLLSSCSLSFANDLPEGFVLNPVDYQPLLELNQFCRVDTLRIGVRMKYTLGIKFLLNTRVFTVHLVGDCLGAVIHSPSELCSVLGIEGLHGVGELGKQYSAFSKVLLLPSAVAPKRRCGAV